ncbi:MAG: hypothetical protein WKF70_15380, partial [Chitinophagaceae bacterium]
DNTSAENHCTIFTIAESPLDEKMIWAGTDDGNLQYTADGGKSWVNVAKAYSAAGIPAQTWVSSIEPSLHSKEVIYATFDNHMYGDHTTYLARSADRGKTWRRLHSTEFTGFAHKIKEDPKNKDLLFLGTEMGLFISTNAGANWFRMKNMVPEYALVRDIQIHPTTNDLILATHGRGIIIIDDITPIRKLTTSILNKEVHLFAGNPVPVNMGQFGSGGFPSTGGWNGGNPPLFPPIQYYLKERMSTGNVTLKIFDDKGKLVQELPATKRKGINKVYWNLRMTPPKVASGGAKIDRAAFVAPLVLPGPYTVKLMVGDKEYSEELLLVHDATNKNFTLEDHKVQYATAMQLYSLHQHLQTLVEEINSKQKKLQNGGEKITDPAVKALFQQYHAALEDLRATLLASKQKSLFADEEQLRERITEVYTAVTTQEARPSNLQMQRVLLLQKETAEASKKHQVILNKFDATAQKELAKALLDGSTKTF